MELELAEHLVQQAKKPSSPEEKEAAFLKAEDGKDQGRQVRADVPLDGPSSRYIETHDSTAKDTFNVGNWIEICNMNMSCMR